MKKGIFFIGLSMLLFACGSTQEEQEDADQTELIESEGTDEDLLASTTMDPRTFGGEKHEDQSFIDTYSSQFDSHDMLGSYVGEFGKNMINITLYKTDKGSAEGFSVCAGNFRRIVGTYEEVSPGEFVFEMDEPGDDEYDGHFHFNLNTEKKSLIGDWERFKEKSTKTYKLERRVYTYDPNVGDWPEASLRELTEDDVNALAEEELATMRNEIYARHGYSFKDKEWRYYFEGRDWYMPMGIDIRHKLTDLEVANIELIYEYESYYEDYYDDYGR